MTADSFVAMHELALEGVGATLLPHFMGRHKRLTLLHALPREMSAAVWLLTHVNLRNTRRIKAFMQHVAEGVRAELEDSPEAPEPESVVRRRVAAARSHPRAV